MKYPEVDSDFWLAMADRVERQQFRDDDPISIPHRFSKPEDQAMAGFFAALLAWGQRPVIIRNAWSLMEAMDFAPDQFIRLHQESDLRVFIHFVHRTFNSTDLLFLLNRLQTLVNSSGSLEKAMFPNMNISNLELVPDSLARFHDKVFEPEWSPTRTKKHLATPTRGSACKRLNMFLRWMVRTPDRGVDFGIWKTVSPAQLYLPLDLHVGRTARSYGLITRPQDDWKSVVQLTEWARTICPEDPARLDFALYGMSLLKLQQVL